MTGAESWEQKIAQHLTPDGSVIVPPRIAKWLQTRADIAPEWRAGLRDSDSEAYEVMMAISFAATQELSASGTKSDKVNGDHPRLSAWMTTAEVADELHITDRTARNWCESGKLPATKTGGRWLIRRTDLAICRLTA